MTDKVQKIREEVARMHNLLPVMDGDNISINYADRICRTLEMYIDSLQEEPVSRTPADVESAMQEVKEKSRAFTEAHQGEDTDTILAQMRGEEHVSNDLEEIASLYVADDALKPWQIIVKEAFKDSAKWVSAHLKEEPINSNLEEAAKNHAVERYRTTRSEALADKCKWSFITGAKWQKKQLMKDAISAELYSDGMLTPLIGVKDKEKLKGIKFGDKVKLIIIKDEQL